jgi:hypothetical protein
MEQNIKILQDLNNIFTNSLEGILSKSRENRPIVLDTETAICDEYSLGLYCSEVKLDGQK